MNNIFTGVLAISWMTEVKYAASLYSRFDGYQLSRCKHDQYDTRFYKASH